MSHNIVTVRFFRDGEIENFELSSAVGYQASVNGGPFSSFSSPWDQDELEEHVELLRNLGDDKPTKQRLREIGKELGAALFQIKGFAAAISADPPVTVLWQLDYPELARIPWELATNDQLPYQHILDDGRDVSFVRTVPAAIPDAPAQWPTGRNQPLRLLFVWGEKASHSVPHEQHLALLTESCDTYDVELLSQEISTVQELVDLCKDNKRPWNFVHILAHGARSGESGKRTWGLQLKDGVAKPEQIASALRAGGTTPAMVTVAACDSANDRDNSFGSVAYQLHVYGVPLVLASQFRLRKDASVVSAAEVYKNLLGGGDVRELLTGIRRQLAPADNEAWSNEVLYSRYRYDSLDELVTIARQQGVLRRADKIRKNISDNPSEGERRDAIEALSEEKVRLDDLIEQFKQKNALPDSLAETYGLLGSLLRRIAVLRSDPPDEEDLRDARGYYADGIRADANSHYCGINVIHISLRLGDRDMADEFIPLVRFAAKSQADSDHWALATAGELEVYAGSLEPAREYYRKFITALERNAQGSGIIRALESSKTQLEAIVHMLVNDQYQEIVDAATGSISVLTAGINRHSKT